MNLCRELRAASRAAALADHEAQRTARAADAAAVGAKRSAAVSKEQLKDALVAEKGCVGKAAERLGVLPGSVYKLVRKYDLLELQQTLAKETAAARHDATVAKRKQYDRERERQRVRNRPVEQVPNRLVGQILPQSAPELQAVEPPPRAPAPAPYQRPPKPWDGVTKKCPPDPRIAARSFNVDDSERVPKKPKNWTGRRVRGFIALLLCGLTLSACNGTRWAMSEGAATVAVDGGQTAPVSDGRAGSLECHDSAQLLESSSIATCAHRLQTMSIVEVSGFAWAVCRCPAAIALAQLA